MDSPISANTHHVVVRKIFLGIVLFGVISGTILFSIPLVVTLGLRYAHAPQTTISDEFPVTVDPQNKIIISDMRVEAMLADSNSPLAASVNNTSDTVWNIFTLVATDITRMPWYQSIAAVDGRFVTVKGGMRKEQVALLFGDALSWGPKEKQIFLTATTSATLPLFEGSFAPGTYFVAANTPPEAAQKMVNDRFSSEVLAHYGSTTAARVPLDQALTIASLIQRETIGTRDMRLVSGIIWNRIFIGMKLQLDATLQYAKAEEKSVKTWWPKVVPADIYRKSAYNTYLNKGLPPTPIANPSVAAILAALNPLKTDCLYYFNDHAGRIHCTNTYAEHMSLLKKYYGNGG